MLNGNTQRKGIAATFCDRWLVIASSSTEAHAGSETHSTYCRSPGCSAVPSALVSSTSGTVPERKAVRPHTATNTPYAMDHIQACWRVVIFGSKSTG